MTTNQRCINVTDEQIAKATAYMKANINATIGDIKRHVGLETWPADNICYPWQFEVEEFLTIMFGDAMKWQSREAPPTEAKK